jgi:(E)-4-hydroxy-3-methylbut-2-enyl-diphosphate synthase
VEKHFQKLGQPITVAVMGCAVNGPGEARDADIGLAAGKGKGAIFRGGQVVRVVDEADYLSALVEEGQKVIAEKTAP